MSSAALAVTVVIDGQVELPEVIITEVQMTGGSASQEFIELYNTTDQDIDLGNIDSNAKLPWKLHFFSSTNVSKGSPVWTQPATVLSLSGVVPANSYFVIAGNGYRPGDVDPDLYFSDRMTSTGGGLQLVDMSTGKTLVHDRLMWSSIKPQPEGTWTTPPNKSSMQRLPNENDQYVIDTGLIMEFTNDGEITPGGVWVEPVEVEEEPETVIDPNEIVTTELPDLSNLATPVITELLPNPAPPDRDEADEFIELYNPNDVAFSLKGYTLQVGISKLYTYTFAVDAELPPMAYTAFYSKDTKLSQSNTGSQARLIDTVGQSVSESDVYSSAKDGLAWALIDQEWRWTDSPTPGTENVYAPTAAEIKAAAAAQKAAAKKLATPKAKKVAAAKKPKVKKAAKVKKSNAAKIASVLKITDEDSKMNVHTGVLAGVAGVAVLYGVYEYRHDIANRFHRIRHYRAIRSRAGP